MADIIKMNYQSMEQAAGTYKQAAATIEEMIAEVKVIIGLLEDDGLVGRAGSALADGLRGSLSNALHQLGAKYTEVENDIRGAMSDMQSADSDTTRFYN